MMSYYCTHNSRGDIIGIYNGDGVLRAQYEYDAWGNVLSVTDGNGNAITSQTHVGNLNPFKYRGYIYDYETGLYYLQSRYYDPTTGRFLNADDTTFLSSKALLGENLFTYCFNNSINRIDTNGTNSNFNFNIVPPGIRPPTLDETLEHLASLLCLNSINIFGPQGVKHLVAQAAYLYLDYKEYYLAYLMFSHAIYGNGNTFNPEVGEYMARLLMGNNDFMTEVKNVAKGTKGELSKGHTYEFTYGELYYAIQKCTFYVQLKYTYGRKYIKVIVEDIFNFDTWRTLIEFSFGNLANNLGYIMQRYNLLTEYNWTVSFTYHY